MLLSSSSLLFSLFVIVIDCCLSLSFSSVIDYLVTSKEFLSQHQQSHRMTFQSHRVGIGQIAACIHWLIFCWLLLSDFYFLLVVVGCFVVVVCLLLLLLFF